jgi:quinol monooxygenase YgiN
MSISFLGALAGTLAALAGAGLLVRLLARAQRLDLVAWVIALAGLAVALAAQAVGYHRGFGPATFRAAQLGAALIAPLALCWGMTELVARKLAARFAARLCLGGLFVVVAVIMATDVLSSQPFSTEWPTARTHYQFLPLGLLALILVVVLGWVAGSLATVGVRSGRDPRWRPALQAVGAASAAALATQALLVHLPVNSGDVALCLVAVAGTGLAGDRAARVRLGALHGAGTGAQPGARAGEQPGYGGADPLDRYADGYRGYGGYPAEGHAGAGYGDAAGFVATGGYGDTGEFVAPGGYRDPGGYPSRAGDSQSLAALPPERSLAALPPEQSLAGLPPEQSLAGLPPEPVTGAFDALYRERGPVPPGGHGGTGTGPAAGGGTPESGIEFVTGMQLAALEEAVLEEAEREKARASQFPAGLDDAGRNGADRNGAGRTGADRNGAGRNGAGRDSDVETERLYGQIAIYTLLEAGAAEFDRMAGQVLAKVQASEPGTLVYVVHAVPSAPLQRILYQVYRDRRAYDEHLRQPYVEDFESRLRPLVLATNVIELGVREAKVVTLRARSAAREQAR